MFLATVLLYPCVLAALCAGAGLAIDRCSGGFLAAPLLLSVGAAALIALSQLSTDWPPIAPATPYLMAALALGGFALGHERVRAFALGPPRRGSLPTVAIVVYAVALAPVLAVGRASFSSYMALADSAVHLIGADFLVSHGRDFGHLDLRNSYGRFLNGYYDTSYPSGADTMFGGSAKLLGLPLIWAFQPFSAFMLAVAAGPCWLLARNMRLGATWAALAALTATLPALVYAYELFGSVKEIAALPMLVSLGALVVTHRSWLGESPARAIPFALVLAAGVSALGLAFGAWALAAVLVLAALSIDQLAGASRPPRLPRRLLALAAVAALTLLIAAWPTWAELPAALRVAREIASTSNSGNLHAPLRAIQLFGVWLNGSYKLAPVGAALLSTHVLVALAFASALLGSVHLLRIRARALFAWLGLTLLASLVVSESVTTWADAKTLVLSSPLVMLLAWGGVAALLSSPRRPAARLATGMLACVLVGGVLVSDALQYHSSDLAPTARFEELASLNRRFAGKGPTLFTDFDEYSMYELRDLDVGGPNFVYPPPALAAAAGGYGDSVELGRVAPRALLAYPLIVTRRDPAASRPPAAYRLLWQGSYYQVWGRRPGAPAAAAHVALAGARSAQCARIGALVESAGAAGARLIAAQAPRLVSISLARARHPARWGHEREGLVMSTPGRLTASFTLPTSGTWDLWVQGQIMPAVTLSVDGRRIASIAGQLDGNSLVPDTVPPFAVSLAAGRHRVSLTRASAGFSLSPGAGGEAVLDSVFLTPAASDPQGPLREARAAAWQRLCGHAYQWVELIA